MVSLYTDMHSTAGAVERANNMDYSYCAASATSFPYTGKIGAAVAVGATVYNSFRND